MVVYLYRWRLKPGKEEQFKEGWQLITQRLREEHHSLGSRLHLGDDGIYYGYAQWPDRETRDLANLASTEATEARLKMRDATAESFPEVLLEPLSDWLVLPLNKP